MQDPDYLFVNFQTAGSAFFFLAGETDAGFFALGLDCPVCFFSCFGFEDPGLRDFFFAPAAFAGFSSPFSSALLDE